MRAVKAAKELLDESVDDDWQINVDGHSESDDSTGVDHQFAVAATKKKTPVAVGRATTDAADDDSNDVEQNSAPERKRTPPDSGDVATAVHREAKVLNSMDVDDAADGGGDDAIELLSCTRAKNNNTDTVTDDAWLVLTSDLSGELPSSFWLDFEVGGVSSATTSTADVHIAVLVDGSAWRRSDRHHIELHDLAPGYHLLRAFLIVFTE